jgi:hypothetical protein
MAKTVVKAIAGAPRPVASADPGRSILWLQGLLCGVLAALATPTALVLGVLLAPGLLSLVLDRAPGRPAARAMLLFGLSATVFPLMALWKAGHTMEVASVLASDPGTLALAWSAAGVGWLLVQLAPLAVRLALESIALSRRRRVRALRARCAAEWGFPDRDEDDADAA